MQIQIVRQLMAVVILAIATVSPASAETVATCGRMDGKAYFAEVGLVPAGSGGWSNDPISGGKTTLSRQANGELDVLYVDATNSVYSAKAEGAIVIPQRRSPTELAVLVAYPGATLEVYTFLRTANGGSLIMAQSKGGSQITKSGVYVAKCELFADF